MVAKSESAEHRDSFMFTATNMKLDQNNVAPVQCPKQGWWSETLSS